MGIKPCPVCTTGQMEKLNRIERDDKSVTTYWRCPKCSHVQVTRAPATFNPNQKPKLGSTRRQDG